MTTIHTCNLSSLCNGLPGVSETWGKFLAEASALCFECHNHPQGVELKVYGLSTSSTEFYWDINLNDQLRNSWGDEQELTEYGACGIAILLILEFTGFTVIRRSRKGTGIDYWLGKKESELPFQEAARLEVSGIFQGDESEVKVRVNRKIKQSNKSAGKLPAFIAVVEFSRPLSHLVQI